MIAMDKGERLEIGEKSTEQFKGVLILLEKILVVVIPFSISQTKAAVFVKI